MDITKTKTLQHSENTKMAKKTGSWFKMGISYIVEANCKKNYKIVKKKKVMFMTTFLKVCFQILLVIQMVQNYQVLVLKSIAGNQFF